MTIRYQFKARIWRYPGKGGWHFVSLPQDLGIEIRAQFRDSEEAWGRLKVKACIGRSEWRCAIWYDSKHKTYLLPLKASIREQEDLQEGKDCEVNLYV